MRARHILVLALSAVLVVANYAESILTKLQFIGGASEAEELAGRWLSGVDIWLLKHGIEPVIVGLLLAVVLSGWVIPDVWPLIKDRLLGASAAEFGAAFRAPDAVDARQEFRLGVEQAYTKFCRGNRDKDTLVLLVDRVRFPNDFPPPEHEPLSGYLASAHWQSPESKALLDFLRALYETAFDASKETLLPEPIQKSFMIARNRVSKFWDDCAREIRRGRMTAASINRQLDSNLRDIKLAAISELILAEMAPWDVGGGKTSLFYLAKEGSSLKSNHWHW